MEEVEEGDEVQLVVEEDQMKDLEQEEPMD